MPPPLAGAASPEEATAFRRHMLVEMARMATEDGLVMTLHPGVHRSHHGPTTERVRPRHRQRHPGRGGVHPRPAAAARPVRHRARASTSSCSPSTRRSSPGRSPRSPASTPASTSARPGGSSTPPRRSAGSAARSTETAGFYRTSGFIDDTRAFLSIPARHDMSRRLDAATWPRSWPSTGSTRTRRWRRPSTWSRPSRRRRSSCEPRQPARPPSGPRPATAARPRPSGSCTSGSATSSAPTPPGTPSTPRTPTSGASPPSPAARPPPPWPWPRRTRSTRCSSAGPDGSAARGHLQPVSAVHAADDLEALRGYLAPPARRRRHPDRHRGRLPPRPDGGPGRRRPRRAGRHRSPARRPAGGAGDAPTPGRLVAGLLARRAGRRRGHRRSCPTTTCPTTARWSPGSSASSPPRSTPRCRAGSPTTSPS